MKQLLAIFDYLAPTPLPNLTILLGLLLFQQQNYAEAASRFKAALDAAADNRHMPGALAKVQRQASDWYEKCNQRLTSSKGHAASRTGCLLIALGMIGITIGMTLFLRQ